MKAFSIGVAGILLFSASTFAPVVALEPAVAKYSSCKSLWKKYPWGVAVDRSAASDAKDDGYTRPDISRNIYMAHRKKFDKDRNGVICERATREQAENYLGNLFEEWLCDKARVEGSPLTPECIKYL